MSPLSDDNNLKYTSSAENVSAYRPLSAFRTENQWHPGLAVAAVAVSATIFKDVVDLQRLERR